VRGPRCTREGGSGIGKLPFLTNARHNEKGLKGKREERKENQAKKKTKGKKRDKRISGCGEKGGRDESVQCQKRCNQKRARVYKSQAEGAACTGREKEKKKKK